MGFSFGDVFKGVGAAVALPFVGSTALAGGQGLLDYSASQKQNDASQNMARAGMDFSAAQAQKQMDFQERMSSTAHQREVTDLKAAGLNPILSANSGASSPGGAAGSSSSGAVVPETANFASSALDSFRVMNEFRTAKAQSDLARAGTRKAGVETDLMKAKGPEAEWDSRFYKFMNDLIDRFSASGAMPFSWKSQKDKGPDHGTFLNVDPKELR